MGRARASGGGRRDRAYWKDSREVLREDVVPLRTNPQGGPRRGRAGKPPPAAPRRHDPQGGRRPLQLPAARVALAHEDRGRHPRGDGGHRRPGDAHPDPHRRGALAPERPLGRLRPRAHAHQGPPRPRVRARPHPRGDLHRPRAQRAQQLQAASRHPLPHPGQVPRREATALRPHALARVHHEGRLLLQRGPGEPAALLRRREPRLRERDAPLRPVVPARRGGHGPDRRQHLHRVHGDRRRRRGRARLLRQVRLRGGHRGRDGTDQPQGR